MVEDYLKIPHINHHKSQQFALFVSYIYLDDRFEFDSYIEVNDTLFDLLTSKKDESEVENFEDWLLSEQSEKRLNYDLMDGHDFEKHIAGLFSSMGYSTEVTKSSGDQGVDVIASKDGIKYGVQTKLYNKPVTNKAIQEVVAGMKYYGLDRGVVVTNNYFTQSAKKLADVNNVILWDKDILEEKQRYLV